MWINKVTSVKHPECAKCNVSTKDDYQSLKCSEPLCSNVMGKQQKNTKEKVSFKSFSPEASTE